MTYLLIFLLAFFLTYLLSLIILPLISNLNCRQNVSRTLERHISKNGTPTMGGFIFIIPFLVLSIFFKINILLIIPSILYAILGFIDDFKKIKYHNNKGLSITQKFLFELSIAIVFYYLYLIKGHSNEIYLFNYSVDIGFIYGIWTLLMFVGFTNAVNITDGLDGLLTGLSIILLTGFLWIIQNTNIIVGTIIIIGALIVFLYLNKHPAKIFMGDLGSLFLGAYIVSMSFVIKKEYLLIIIGFVFIIEILSSFIQVICIKLFHKKIFLKAPLHHHFEELNISEKRIVYYFYVFGLVMMIIGLLLEKTNIFK